jgi:DNA-binding protein YbaB
MKVSTLAAAFFVAAALVVSCKSTTETSPSRTGQDSAAALQLVKAKAATAEAVVAMDDYAYARKAEFVAKMESELVATQEELDRLGVKVASSAGAVKAEATTKLDAARVKLAQSKQQLQQAENATESTWNDVKKGFKESYGGLKDSIVLTRQWLSDKIAP